MLIGLTGCKGVGKNTAANFLEGYTQLAFADKLKEAVANLFGITPEVVDEFKEISLKDNLPVVEVALQQYNTTEWHYSWREFLQRFGTEMGRNTFGQNFWVDLLLPLPQVLADAEDIVNTVVTDVRFPNEAVRIKLLGGAIIEILRPGHEPDGHASEKPLPSDLVDIRLNNNGTLDDLRNRIQAAITALESGVQAV